MIGPVIESSSGGNAGSSLTLEQNSPAVKNKLDSVMGRLDDRSAEDSDGDNEPE